MAFLLKVSVNGWLFFAIVLCGVMTSFGSTTFGSGLVSLGSLGQCQDAVCLFGEFRLPYFERKPMKRILFHCLPKNSLGFRREGLWVFRVKKFQRGLTCLMLGILVVSHSFGFPSECATEPDNLSEGGFRLSKRGQTGQNPD